jgi:DNA-binding transcriptional MocR family regulator
MPVNSYADHPLSWTPSADVGKKRPVYLALAAELEDAILTKRLPEGARLPPQRVLADFLDLDFTTVTRAYNICRDKGLVHGVCGRGTFVASRNSPDGRADIVDCGVVQGFPEACAADITAAAREVLSRTSATALFSYRNRDGSPSSLKAARKWLELNGIAVDEKRTAVFPGAQGAISAALFALFHPGDAVAVDEFTYANFISLARLAHLKLVPIAADRYGMRPDGLEKAASAKAVKGVFLMPREANPTGKTLSEKRKTDLAAVIRNNGLILIEDDANLVLPGKGEKPIFARVPERTVYIAGSTRNIAPGIRATFMAFPGPHAERILNALHHLTIKAGILDAEILAELILSGRAEKILAAKTEMARQANALFDGIFPSGPRASSTALFRTLPLPGTSGHGQAVESRLRAAGVAVCHSDRFSVKPGRPDSFIRISVSSDPTPSHLRKGLEIISRFRESQKREIVF